MERIPVKSSQIKSVGFEVIRDDAPNCEGSQAVGVLEIEFKGGSVYRYDNVPSEEFDALMIAESVGAYFGKNIKAFPEKFPFKKIRGTDLEEAGKAQKETVVTA